MLGYWTAGPEDPIDLVREAERLGYDSVWTAEADFQMSGRSWRAGFGAHASSAAFCTPASPKTRAGKAPLPQPTDAVPIEQALLADESQALELRLRHEHPVEGIPVRPGQASCALGVTDGDVHLEKVLRGEIGGAASRVGGVLSRRPSA